jgi:hypothetical protein
VAGESPKFDMALRVHRFANVAFAAAARVSVAPDGRDEVDDLHEVTLRDCGAPAPDADALPVVGTLLAADADTVVDYVSVDDADIALLLVGSADAVELVVVV